MLSLRQESYAVQPNGCSTRWRWAAHAALGPTGPQAGRFPPMCPVPISGSFCQMVSKSVAVACRDLEHLGAVPSRQRCMQRSELCHSLAGNPCPLITITNPSSHPHTQRPAVVFTGTVLPAKQTGQSIIYCCALMLSAKVHSTWDCLGTADSWCLFLGFFPGSSTW